MTTELAPVVPDTLSLWPDRDSFLGWCRSRGIQGSHEYPLSQRCIVAEALNHLTGHKWRVAGGMGESYRGTAWCIDELRLPDYLAQVVRDFDHYVFEGSA